MAKTKLQITIDSELLKDVDDYCDRNYMNRSWLISQALVQVINQQKVVDSMLNLSISLKKAVERGDIDDDVKKEIESFDALSKLFLGNK